jgi:hypothetical protein
MLFVWFDYLGMKDLVTECDDAYAGYIYSNCYFSIGRLDMFIEIWKCKGLHFPKSQEAEIENLGTVLDGETEFSESDVLKLKALIRDDVGDGRVWQEELSKLSFPQKIKDSDRVVLAQNPLFECILVMSSNSSHSRSPTHQPAPAAREPNALRMILPPRQRLARRRTKKIRAGRL